MTVGTSLEDVILALVGLAEQDLGINKLTIMVDLADVEHQQLYGEPLSNAVWQYQNRGPFGQRISLAIESLEDQDPIADVLHHAEEEMGGRFTAIGDPGEVLERLSPRARRVLGNVVSRYGHLSVQQIEPVASGTATMRNAKQGECLDLSHEPHRSLGGRVPGLAAFLERAPAPIVRDVGDPLASAAEDIAILDELEGLRRAANRELV